MDNLKKVGLTALGTALVSSTAFAGGVSVTGTAQVTLTGEDNTNHGNGWSMTDSLSFSGSADLDNGWAVTYNQAIDGGAAAGNTDIVVNMGDMGTYTFVKQGVSGPVSSWDDKTPSANEESYANVTGATNPDDGFSSANAHLYTNGNLMDGVSISIGYQPSNGTADLKSSTEYGIQYTGIDGLEVGYAMGDNEGSSAVTENSVFYATYAMDAFTIGIQTNEVDSETADADYDFEALGVSYAVSDDLSISYGMAEVSYENSSLTDQESGALSFSYTNGSMTVSSTYTNVDNIGGTSTSDNSGYEINFKFAF
jgi:outer membrane protein OmpU